MHGEDDVPCLIILLIKWFIEEDYIEEDYIEEDLFTELEEVELLKEEYTDVLDQECKTNDTSN